MSELDNLERSWALAEDQVRQITNPDSLYGVEYAEGCLKRMKSGEQIWVDVELWDDVPTDGDRHFHFYDGEDFTRLAVIEPSNRQDLPYIVSYFGQPQSLGGISSVRDAMYQASAIHGDRQQRAIRNVN